MHVFGPWLPLAENGSAAFPVGFWAVFPWLALAISIFLFAWVHRKRLQQERRLREQTEDALWLSEDRFRRAFEQAPIGMVKTDPDGRFVDFNRRFCSMLGYSGDELRGKSLLKVTFIEDLEATRQAVQVLEKGEQDQISLEKRFVHKNGQNRWANTTVSALHDQQGALQGFIAAVEDVTDRRESEKSLNFQRQRLDMALWGANAGLWDWSVESDDLVTGEIWNTMLGYTPQQLDEAFGASMRRLTELVHPDDLPKLQQALEDHVDGRTDACRSEFRMKTAEGKWKWIQGIGKAAHRDAGGKGTRLVGVHLDIDSFKETEARESDRQARRKRLQDALAKLAQSQKLTSGNLKAAYAEISEAASEGLDIDRVSIWLFDAEQSLIHCEELYDRQIPGHDSGWELFASDFPEYFRALKQEIPIAASDAWHDPRTASFREVYLEPLGITSMLDVPLQVGGQLLGVICHEHRGPMRNWSVDERNFARSINNFVVIASETSRRRKAQKAAEASRHRFETVLNGLDALVYVADMDDHELLFMNECGRRMWGDALGRKCWAVLQGDGKDPCSDCTNPKLLDASGLPTGVHVREEYDSTHKRWYQCRDQAIRWPDGRWVRLEVAVDITEIRETERALQQVNEKLLESEGRLKEAEKIAQMGHWELDRDHDRLFWSDEIYRIFELEASSCSPDYQVFQSLVHPEDQEIVNQTYGKFLHTQENYEQVYRLKMPEGRIKFVRETYSTLFHPNGEPWLSRGTIADISELARVQQELQESNLRLQELDRLKSMFIASMSHELRTPLNSIIGFSGLFLQGILGEIDEEQRDSLERIHRSGNHLLSLISDVIDISKIEAGRLDSSPSHFFLHEVLKQAVDTVRGQAEAKNLTLEVEAECNPEIFSERRRLLQCLLNYLSNAVKFTEDGGITVKVGPLDDGVEIQVIDTGIGISKEDEIKLFEAFERLDSHLRVKAGGTGLGLYLTKKIAEELLQGQVFVESELGAGSTFGLRIPLHLREAELVI
ncbi:MAG: PAS domain S-box protein [Planctomycetota bacterium]|nr:MAG: PAS domain S-box protein [Planctomycetota bacterium]